MQIYVAGPMTSVGGNFNFPLFDFVTKRLRATAECDVFNPAEHARRMLGPLEDIQKLDKHALADARKALLKDELVWICEKADVVLLLPGWERSSGAKAEVAVAEALDIPARELPGVMLPDIDNWLNAEQFTSSERTEDGK